MRREELWRHLLEPTPEEKRNTLLFPAASPESTSVFWDALETSAHQSLFCLKRTSRFVEHPLAAADCLTIRFVYSGRDEIRTPDSSFCLQKNDLCLFNRGFMLSEQLSSGEDLVFLLQFEKEFLLTTLLRNLKETGDNSRFILDHIVNSANPQNYIIFHGRDNSRLAEVIEDILCEFLAPTQYGQILLDSYLKILLIEMMHCPCSFNEAKENRQSTRLAEILDYIDSNYKTVTLDVLAKEFNYNNKYISRLIKVHTGKNFKDLILERQMAEVCSLLVHTDLSISQILLQTGMNNETYFYKKFRELYGSSPNAYRRAWQNREDVS
jgi:AraC-like DNA-binding protein